MRPAWAVWKPGENQGDGSCGLTYFQTTRTIPLVFCRKPNQKNRPPGWATKGKSAATGLNQALETPARLVAGRTMVPLRFISEGFGAK
ncbi:MAG: stalk domain-containing protein [Desulfotomaculaceae bacterium]|nr:stalk domain-containing protein [Desulfotomaculaceae bacterium]